MQDDGSSLPHDAAQAPPEVHARPPGEVAEALGADVERGLAGAEAARRAALHGANELEEAGAARWPAILARQFVDVLIGILLLAAALALLVGEVGDALTILAIVLANGALGFVQEWKAERSLAALRSMLSPRCHVVRDGDERELDARALVPGDLVVLRTGDRVPADLRLVSGVDLRVDESALTGESAVVSKAPEPVPADAPLAERASMTWMGTAVTNGRARGLVVATGMATELGHIARLAGELEEEHTPLQRKLSTLGKQLGVVGVATTAVVVLVGALAGRPLLEMLFTGVALAVAVVPEGLPAVVTVTLALGTRAMLRRRILLRRLQAAEALGAATVVCSDKTGTLTRNEMTVARAWLPKGELRVTGVGYEPSGEFERDGARVDPEAHDDLRRLLRAGLECNDARVYREDGAWREIGEPTEAALVVAAHKAGLAPRDDARLLAEVSFESARKRMTRVLVGADGTTAYTKGAPEVLLERCARVLDGGEERALSEADRRAVADAVQALAGEGLRTLALADRALGDDPDLRPDALESELTFLGLVGILDPPRAGVSAAVRTAREAGVLPLMITGDAPGTALAIARQVGLPAERALTGPELDALDDAGLDAALDGRTLFARTTPAQKLRIVERLQARGAIVGMTGDGVNDAPALKRADIGIAMGLRGTEVARGAADIVLTDDDFSSIVAGIEEGRRQNDNIRKFVSYLLSSNAGEVLTVLGSLLLGGPLVLLPVQILWMNLVTDGMSAVALGLEPAEHGLMRRPPRAPDARILNRRSLLFLGLIGLAIGAATTALFALRLRGASLDEARTLAFTGIVLIEKTNVFNFRSFHAPLAKVGWLSNPWLLLAVAGSLGLQLAAVYLPPLQRLLHTVPLSAADWLLLAAVALPFFVVVEGGKWSRWRRAEAR